MRETSVRSWVCERERERERLSAEETLKVGSYNALLKSTLPEEYKYYKAEEETFESSHDVFRSAFPRGFAWEVIRVHSGPPVISYKFWHWGTLKVDESMRAEDVEIYYDLTDLISKLLKGELISQEENTAADAPPANTGNCPFEKQV
ncbi:unnamed protein product [Lactuca saligna]|uniref:Pathogen-related protein n=1 Tax=Lactuca saligna TaxID=75948 RepID=A0AA35UNU8_LACSI|nr:unnamed protein product [Lactuca saligna]